MHLEKIKMLATTLNKLKAKNPCKEGEVKLLKYLNKTKADDEPLTFKTLFIKRFCKE